MFGLTCLNTLIEIVIRWIYDSCTTLHPTHIHIQNISKIYASITSTQNNTSTIVFSQLQHRKIYNDGGASNSKRASSN